MNNNNNYIKRIYIRSELFALFQSDDLGATKKTILLSSPKL